MARPPPPMMAAASARKVTLRVNSREAHRLGQSATKAVGMEVRAAMGVVGGAGAEGLVAGMGGIDRDVGGDAAGAAGHDQDAGGEVDALEHAVGDEGDGQAGGGPEGQEVVVEAQAGDFVECR